MQEHVDVEPRRIAELEVPARELGDQSTGVWLEYADVSLTVGVAPTSASPLVCATAAFFDECVTDSVDGHEVTIAWQQLEPEEDPGVVYVIDRRQEEDVLVKLSGASVTDDPRNLDLGVPLADLAALVADPRLSLTTTPPVVELGAKRSTLNRALWAVMNERFTDAAADDLWSRPDDGLETLRGAGPRSWASSATCRGSTSSSWCAARLLLGLARSRRGRDGRCRSLRRAAGTARRLQVQLGPRFPLVQGDAERVPLASGHFDLVVSEHGAAAWCDPEPGCPKRPGSCDLGGAWCS